MTEPTDAELHVGILAGDQGAVARWHDRVAPSVRGLLRRKGIPDQDAEEIFDDVFVSTIRRAATITPLGSGLRRYIVGAAAHKIADHYEKASRRAETLPLRDEDAEPDETIAPGRRDPVVAAAIARSTPVATSVSPAVRRLRDCLEKVRPGVRRLAEMWMDNATEDEIADALRIAKTSVRKYVQRMKAALQGCIEGKD